MKGLIVNGILCCGIVTQPAFAEFSPLNEYEMSGVSGQAGLSIELAAKVEIGEIAYQDEGFLLVRDFSLGGIGGTTLDNMLITVDVAGNNEVLNYGFSRMAAYANAGLVDSGNADVASAIASYDQGGGNYGKAFNDGDLVVHIDSIDSGVIGGNTSEQNLSAYNSAIDFEMTVGSVEYAQSGYSVGSGSNTGGNMFSDVSIQGYLGPVDIVIRNAGSTQTLINPGMTAAESRTEIEANFVVTDLDVNWENADFLLIFNFGGLTLKDVKVHNTRGHDTVGHFGMASVKATIAEGTSTLTGVTGLAIHDIDLRMDLDLPHVQFGTAPSIGEVYMTDFIILSDVLVYGH